MLVLEVVHLHRRGHPWSPRGTVISYIHSLEAVTSGSPRASFAARSYFGSIFSLVSGMYIHPKLHIFVYIARRKDT